MDLPALLTLLVLLEPPEIWEIRQEVSLSLTYGNQALPYVF